MKKILAATGFAAVLAGSAMAQGPVDGHIGLLPAFSPIAEELHAFHYEVLLPIITGICLLVLALLLWVMLRYNKRANPTPKKFSHNTMVEVIWTAVPILILLFIALPSFDLLFKEDVIPDGKQVVVQGDGAATEFDFRNDFPERRMVARNEHLQVYIASPSGERLLAPRADYAVEGLGEPDIRVTLKSAPQPDEKVVIRGGRSLVGAGKVLGLFGEDRREIALAPSMTIKVTGFQWGWIYSYPDFGDFEFSSNPLPEDQTTPELYLWEVDNRVVVPVGETIRITTTARDVIHSWAMPNFAVKIDAVPGRINEAWFSAEKEGVYYGQCSEICGIKHSFMPIAVEVVSRPKFEAWVDEQRALAGLEPMFGGSKLKLAEAPGAAQIAKQ